MSQRRQCSPAVARRVAGLLFPLTAYGLLAAGCGSDATGPDDDTARIEGRVAGGAGHGAAGFAEGVGGAVVVAQRFREDGTIELVSRESDTTTDGGDFVLDTDLDGERFVVIVATKGPNQWRAVVSGELRLGEIVRAPPLNDETTLEALVYERLVQSGAEQEASHAETQAIVTKNVSVAAAGLPSLRTQIADGMEAFGLAESRVLTAEPIRAPGATLDAVRARKLEAEAELEAALAAAGDSASVAAALASFGGKLVSAYASEGIALADHAKALLAALGAMEHEVSSGDPRGTVPVFQGGSLRRVPSVDEAVQFLFEELGASAEVVASVAAAGALLDEDVRAARDLSAIEAALGLYHVRILDLLKEVFPDLVLLIDAMDVHIVFDSGWLGDLQGRVSTASSARDVASAYMTYYDDVRTFITNAHTDLTAGQLSAIADLLIIVTLDRFI